MFPVKLPSSIAITMKIIYLQFFLCCFIGGYSQAQKSTNYYSSISACDLSELWSADSILHEEEDGKLYKGPFPEPLGFIGTNFQRFYIHYTSVVKSTKDPYVYLVAGKTKMKKRIRSFNGRITISKAVLYDQSFHPRFKQGEVAAEVFLQEDSSAHPSGFIKGNLKTTFYVDANNKSFYASFDPGDGYCNNLCEARWTNYRTRQSKICNWGDYRIPGGHGLDIGAGEFAVSSQYEKFGWQTFEKARTANDTKEGMKAMSIEKQPWWK
jgi:hypothetical protein